MPKQSVNFNFASCLWNIGPAFFCHDISNCFVRNTISFGNYQRRSIFFEKRSDFFNLFIGKLGHGMSFANKPSISFFFNHILNVIILSTNKKMGRPNTFSIITFMTHKKAFFNQAFADFPRVSVSFKDFTIYIKSSISLLTRASPIPALTRFFNIIPKIFFCVWWHHMGSL